MPLAREDTQTTNLWSVFTREDLPDRSNLLREALSHRKYEKNIFIYGENVKNQVIQQIVGNVVTEPLGVDFQHFVDQLEGKDFERNG
jgi:hypothetical protein